MTSVIMLFGKYFRREIFTYWFLVLLPLILVTELWLYFWETHKLYGEILEIFCILLWPISFSISATLALIQMISCYILFFRCRKLSSEQRTGLRDAARSQKKTGRILQSEEVILYYGMFSKKVLLKCDIVSMRSNKTTNHVHVRGGAFDLEFNSIVFQLKSGRSVEFLCNNKIMDGYEGELPWKSIRTVVLLGVALLVMGCYPLLIKMLCVEKNIIESVLFYIKYDWIFCSVSVVFIVAFGIYLLWIKKKCLNAGDKRGITTSPSLLLWIVPILVLFCYIIIYDKYEASKLASADLESYREGDYEETIVHIQEVSEKVMQTEEDNIRYYVNKYLDSQWVPYICIACEEEVGAFENFYFLIGDKSKCKEGQTYCIRYLESTKIIVELEKIEKGNNNFKNG